MSVRVGIIGAGFGARVQVQGFRKAGFDVVGIASASETRAHAAAESLDIPFWTSDVMRLCERSDIDLISVASPPSLHHDHTMAALQAGQHVLCEKPFAQSAAQALEMVLTAEAAGVVHAVDFELRYMPARSMVKELIGNGSLGAIRVIHVMDLSSLWLDRRALLPDWLIRRESSGGLLGQVGSHWIDAILWWCGDVELIGAQLRTFVRQRVLDGGSRCTATADDTCELLLRSSEGAIITMLLSRVVPFAAERVTICGSRSTLVLDGSGQLLMTRRNGSLRELVPEPAAKSPVGYLIDAFEALAVKIAERIQEGRPSQGKPLYPTFWDGLRVQQIMDAAYAAG